MTSTGPSTDATCRILNNNSCGSGTVCGIATNGGRLVLSNAHVTGTRLNRRITVESEKLGQRFEGRIVRAAYSSTHHADWSLIEVPGLEGVDPVYLSNELPKTAESFYTKGFPQCRPMESGNIEQVRITDQGILLWLPESIGGQSGSGVFSDNDHYIKALLTWGIKYDRWYGAGQLTFEIWRQNRDFFKRRAVSFFPKIPGVEYLEMHDYDLDFDRTGLDDPIVEDGIFAEPTPMTIQDYPIWAHMFDDPEPPVPPTNNDLTIRNLTGIKESLEDEIERLQGQETDIIKVDPADPTFGLG